MRINEYEILEDFIYEYSRGKEFSWQNKEHRERFMGIEFLYKGTYYRMCREPFNEEYTPILSNGNPAMYDVMIMHCDTLGYPSADEFEIIGWYEDLDDVLDSCILQGQKFRDVIMDDSTKILSKD